MTDLEVTPALELRGVHAAYEQTEVLRGVSLTVPAAHVVALLGPNGAGKSTTFRVASARMSPLSGSVLIDGEDIAGRAPETLARSGVCSIPEGRGIFPSLTVAENLRMWTFRSGTSRRDVEDATYARFPRLAERRRQLAGTLSGGEQQMLAMSRALTTNPRLLMLDEISMGLAPKIVGELYELVVQLAAEGIAILLVEQFAHAALRVATDVYVMRHGQIRMSGTPDEVRAALADAYLDTVA